MKKSKILACVSALFAMVLVGCNNTSKSSDNPSVTPSSETTSQAPTSSVGGNSSSTPAPSSSKTESSSKTPTPSSSSSVHVCEHVCPQCGKCQDETCTDPACADKCSGHGQKPIETVDVVYGADGTFTLEAENSQITGVNTTTEPGEGFVLERASDNPDHQTSNGSCVLNWASTGNAVTWKVKYAAAEEKVQFKLWVACGGTQAASGLGLTINGTGGYNWKESQVVGKGSSEQKWYYWQELNTEVNFPAGESTISITNLSGQPWNLDCIVLKKYVEPTHFCQHVCPYCGKCMDETCTDPECATKCAGHTMITFGDNGKYRVEAENYDLATGSIVVNDVQTSSGGKEIGGFAGQATATYYLVAETAMSGVHIDACYGLGQNPSDNGAIELTVNGTHIHEAGWTQESHPDHDNIGMHREAQTTGWACDHVASSQEFDLVAGINTIVLAAPWGSAGNVDYFEIVSPNAPKTVRFEAESFDSSTGPAAATDSGTASAGKIVGDFHSQSSLTYTIIADKAITGATLKVCYGLGQNYGDNGAVELTVNSTHIHEAGWTQEAHPDHDNLGMHRVGEAPGWGCDYTATSQAFDLNAGENTFVLAAPWGSAGNVDYFEIIYVGNAKLSRPVIHECAHECPYCGKCTDETCTDPVCEVKCAGHTTIAFDGNGKYRVEAENYDSATGSIVVNDVQTSSGGKEIGGFAGQATATYYLVAETAISGVHIDACYGLGQNPSDNGAIELKVNGTHIHEAGWTQEAHPDHDNLGMHREGQTTGWACDHVASSQEFDLVEGINTIVLAAPWGSAGNVDYFDIVTSALPTAKATSRFEAEYAALSEGIVRLARSASASEHKTSGALCVGGLDKIASGSTISWKITADEAEAVALTAWVANCSGNTNSDSVIGLKVNGVDVTTNDTLTAIDNVNWYRWEAITAEVSLNEGTNTVELISKGVGCNVDCVDIEASAANNIVAKNVARIEAEDSQITGTPQDGSKVEDYTVAKETGFYNTSASDSNGGSVGNWYKGDTNLHSYFSVDKDTTVTVVVFAAWADTSDLDIASHMYGVGVDGYQTYANLSFVNENAVSTDGSYHDWVGLYITTTFTVTAGEHYVHIEASDGAHLNLDCIDIIAADQTATVTALGVPSAN